jgi:hypothetical protein
MHHRQNPVDSTNNQKHLIRKSTLRDLFRPLLTVLGLKFSLPFVKVVFLCFNLFLLSLGLDFCFFFVVVVFVQIVLLFMAVPRSL